MRSGRVMFISVGRGSGPAGSPRFDAIAGRGGLEQGRLAAAAAGPQALTVQGGNGDELFTGTGVRDVIGGGRGDDTIHGLGGSDYLRGDEGADRIYGGDNGDALDGDAGRDRIFGGEGADDIDGGTGGDRLKGEGGNDTIYSSHVYTGAVDEGNLLRGGAGDDELYLQGVDDTARGGAGDDLLATNFHDVEDAHLYGGRGDDILSKDSGLAATLDGGAGNDRLSCTMDSGSGYDLLLVGRQGLDRFALDLSLPSGSVLDFGAAADGTITPVEGLVLRGFERGYVAIEHAARIEYGALDLDVFASWEGDTLIGGAGRSRFDGNGGNDLIDAGAGNDTLNGGVGGDTLIGGEGRDLLIMAPGTVDLRITGKQQGGDRISGVEDVMGSRADDLIIGDGGDNHLTDGVWQPNPFRAPDAADTLKGGDGADTLSSILGMEVDVLFGGAGADRFVITGCPDTYYSSDWTVPDLIMDLEDGDVIDLSDLDADRRGGEPTDQAFRIVDAFTGKAGELVIAYDQQADRTLLMMDIYALGHSYMEVAIQGDHRGFTDIIL